MKKSVFTLMAVLLLVAAGCQQAADGIQVSDLHDLSPVASELSARFDQIFVAQPLQNKGKYTFTEDAETHQSFVEGEGTDQDGNAVIFRAECKVSEGQGGGKALKLVNMGESCSGNNCSLCAFATGGGCTCRKAASPSGENAYCNHTVTK
ncbi:MAG: hypothetical protein H6581_07985 [Bacteroidia bacterium]|nr:hypothetical protein [Bacteroidia bacterium]